MKHLVFTLLLLMVLLVGGCETFKGFGRDVQKAGDWIEDTASK